MFNLSDKELAVLRRLKEDAAYENYFFSKVHAPKWLSPLLFEGFFDPGKAPALEYSADGKYVTEHEWKVLPYLLRLAEQELTDELVSLLLSALFQISSVAPKGGRTTWYVIRILARLTPDQIPLDILRLLPEWLVANELSVSLSGPELGSKLLPKLLSGSPNADNKTKVAVVFQALLAFRTTKVRYGDDFELRKVRFAIDPHWIEKAFMQNRGSLAAFVDGALLDELAGRTEEIFEAGADGACYLSSRDGEGYKATVIVEKDHYVFELFKEADPNVSLGTSRFNKNGKLEEVIEAFASWLKGNIKEIDEVELRRAAERGLMSYYSHHTFDSLRTPGFPGSKEPEHIAARLFVDVSSSFCSTGTKEGEAFILGLVARRWLFFPKVSLYLISKYPEHYRKLFWSILERMDARVLFDETYFGDELKGVLEAQQTLTEEQQEKLERLICQIALEQRYLENENLYQTIWKQKRFAALKHNERFARLYDECAKTTGRHFELKPKLYPVEVRSGWGPSPIDVFSLAVMSNDQIAAFLSEFKNDNKWDGPSAWSLANELRTLASSDPDKLTDDLEAFINSAYLYVDRLLEGLKSAFKEGRNIDWSKITSFVARYTQRPEFWRDELPIVSEDMLRPTSEWVAAEIANMVESGARKPDWDAPDETKKQLLNLLVYFLQELKVERPIKIDDPVDRTINSTRGKVVEALIHFALHLQSRKLPGWESICGVLDSELQKSSFEGFTLVGLYLPQLMYLDRAWTKQTLIGTLLSSTLQYYKCFADGYLSPPTLYKEVFEAMSPHYSRLLAMLLADELKNGDRLIHELSLAYVRGYTDLSISSVFGEFMEKAGAIHLKEVVGFLQSIARGFLGEKADGKISLQEAGEVQNRVLSLWDIVVGKCKDLGLDDSDVQDVLGSSSGLIEFFDAIDERALGLLEISAPFAQRVYLGHEVIRVMCKLKDRASKDHEVDAIGRILFGMLRELDPSYDEADIVKLVTFLFSKQAGIKWATDIRELVGRRGYEFLRPVSANS